jgi:hypothetical protein
LSFTEFPTFNFVGQVASKLESEHVTEESKTKRGFKQKISSMLRTEQQ